MSQPWPPLADEAERLAVLSALDAAFLEPTDRFERITRMATRDLRVPIALVSLIDQDRQWFKAAIGVTGTSAPRSGSLCSYTLAGTGVLVVPDLTADPRFCENPAVTGPPRARSYAGHPLRIGGRRVGTICVMDVVSRTFDESELAALIDLAAWAESELLGEQSRRLVKDLEQLQRRTEMVLAGVAEGVIGVDAHGIVTFVNRAASSLLIWPRGSLVGQDMHAAVHHTRADGSSYPREDCPVTDVLRTGRERRLLREVFWRRDGRPVPVDWSAGAVVEEDEVVGAVLVFGDAAGRIEMERVKDEFVSVVSHELRTPLTSLSGALGLLAAGLLGGAAGAEAHRLVDIAQRNAERLTRLVNDILDLERLARGSISLVRQPLDVAALVDAAVETVQVLADRSEILVRAHVASADVWGDEHRLIQVLTNLLGNAIRFSPRGSTVHVTLEQDAGACRLVVRDEGIGIPDDQQSRVFDRFWQVDSSDGRAKSGTGLGLAIAREIVESHGGLITVDSVVSQGSTFTVTLPLRVHRSPIGVERRHTMSDEGEAS